MPDGTLVRSLLWSHHDTINVRVAVEGLQFSDDGRIERGITVTGQRIGDLDCLTPEDARHLAVKLLEAADVLLVVARSRRPGDGRCASRRTGCCRRRVV